MLTATVYPAHERQIMEAYLVLKENKRTNVIQVPGKTEIYLVRESTGEANKRKRDKVALFEIEIEGEKFLICKM